VIERMSEKADPWKFTLKGLLPMLGHRNWIVIADAAYPAQSNPGIETIATGADHLLVLKATLDAIQSSKHVRANIYMDAEFKCVSEQDAPGVTAYRQKLTPLLAHTDTQVLPHEQVIARLDESGKLFRVLILKSTLAIPYTSVFLELDCGYWTREAEERLRLTMAKGNHHRLTRSTGNQTS
jgi:L-fucose mutarotase/ribose pyranase (RbsD/FucU family)